MLAYAVPRVAYKNEPGSDQSNESANNADNWDENNDFFQQEAVDETATAPIYFIFSRVRLLSFLKQSERLLNLNTLMQV
jgi:hypothetical protein